MNSQMPFMTISSRVARISATALSVLQLVGCAAIDRAENAAKGAAQQADNGLSAISRMRAEPAVVVTPDAWLLGERVALGRQDPAWLSQEVHLATAQPITLDQLAQQITQMTAIPVHVSAAAREFTKPRENQTAVALPAVPGGNSSAFVLPPLPSVGRADEKTITINWRGALRGLLDLAAAQTGVFWKYESGAIQFFLTETRIYDIAALPGAISADSSISNSGASGGATGAQTASQASASTQTARSQVRLDHFAAIENAVRSILKQAASESSQKFSSVSIDPASGQLVVTATPPELDAVERYVRAINSQMARNVLVDVRVYSVSINENAESSFNLYLALNRAKGDLKNFGIYSSGSNNPVAGTLSAAIVSGSLDARFFFQALSQYGRTSLVTRGSIIALNGYPTPLQVSESQGYLASSSTTVIPNSGTTTALNPGTVVSGFSGTFLPLVRGDRILLEYAINLTQNRGFQTVSSGGSTIMTPNTASQALVQRASLRSGDTLVLSGFEQASDTVSGQDSLGSGGKKGGSARSMIVITMHVKNLGG
jgi:type IVB pilus formation R64 PilN family outer membrane protein